MMLKAFQKHINQNLPFLKESKLLIAISGGLDSVVLTHLCHKAELNFALAHCNFSLRGSESDNDEAFVLQLAEDLNVEIFIECFDTETYAKTHKLSIQMAARELRYDWFYELSEQLKFDYILTAHHADDNLETFLINIARGTGLDGLTGIPETNEQLVRPLIPFSRAEIENFAKDNQMSWQEDSSNASSKYVRNALRHNVIPKLKEIKPEWLQNFQKTQSHLQGSKAIIEDALARIQKKVVSVENDIISFNIKKLKKLSNTEAYLYELLKDFGFTEWNDVYHLLEAQSGKQIFSPTHRLLKDREYLILTETPTEENHEDIVIAEATKQVSLPLGTLFFDEADSLIEKRSDEILVDKDLLNFPLTVRKWQKGDYFYPLEMQGKKKLSKFFKDEKLSLVAKEKIWVLCSNYDIIWIINYRADNRFKVTNSTKQSLKIKLQQ